MKNRWSYHLLALCLLTLGVSLLFLQEPGFGDDLTYWTFGYDLHESGMAVWSRTSFHDLRWPVWGWCWVLQGLGCQGISAYSGVALIYLTAGAAVAFTFGRLLTKSIPFSWACGLAFVFCPLLDTLCHRPMPDLSEGVWGGLTLLAWLRLMKAETPRASIGWAVLTGLGVYICESNRLTGVFIVPVLIAATLFFARKRFFWLVAAGVFSMVFYAAEAAFYHHLFGDWLHNLNANLNGKDNKGTGNIPFLTSPFRFLDSLWKVGRLSPFYTILSVIGLGSLALRRRQPDPSVDEVPATGVTVPIGPLIALWFILLYLEYACAPQHLYPWAPVIRDASRFLAGLAIPFSILAVLGLRALFVNQWLRGRRGGRWIPEHPFIVGAAALILLITFTSRPFFDLGFLGEMRTYVQKVPNGTTIFTHHMMRSLAIMADPSAAKRLKWYANREILDFNPILENVAGKSDEFWYMHKIVWMNDRKRMEKIDKETKTKTVTKQPPMATYFADTEKDWALAKLLIKGDSPDLIFYRRRTPASPAAVPLAPDAPELASLIPTLPVQWTPPAEGSKGRSVHLDWDVPEELRGKCIRLDVTAFSNEVETCGVSFKYNPVEEPKEKHLYKRLWNRLTASLSDISAPGARSLREILVKPYTYPEPGRDFFLIPIPAKAARCAIQLRFSKAVKQATLTEFKATVLTPTDGMSWVTDRVGLDHEGAQ